MEPHFDSIAAFLAMGDHGFYVWFAYALALAVVVYTIGWPLRRQRRFVRAQRGRLRRTGEAGGTATPGDTDA